jgi:hypothetical protein
MRRHISERGDRERAKVFFGKSELEARSSSKVLARAARDHESLSAGNLSTDGGA